MIFGREDSNGAWEAYGKSLEKKLKKIWTRMVAVFLGGWKNTGREVFDWEVWRGRKTGG